MTAEKTGWPTAFAVATSYDIACPECDNDFVIPAIPPWESLRDGNFTVCPDCAIEMLIEDWEHAYDG